MKVLGKKWTIHILRDMFKGITKYSDFLTESPGMSTRVLSQRLKELQADGMVRRIVLNKTPIQIRYQLTEKGFALHETILALSKFSIIEFPERVFDGVKVTPMVQNDAIAIARKRFTTITSVDQY